MSRTVYTGVTTKYVGAKMKLNLEEILKEEAPVLKLAEEKMVKCIVCSNVTNMMLDCGHFICNDCHYKVFKMDNAVPVRQSNGDIHLLNTCPECNKYVTSLTSQFN